MRSYTVLVSSLLACAPEKSPDDSAYICNISLNFITTLDNANNHFTWFIPFHVLSISFHFSLWLDTYLLHYLPQNSAILMLIYSHFASRTKKETRDERNSRPTMYNTSDNVDLCISVICINFMLVLCRWRFAVVVVVVDFIFDFMTLFLHLSFFFAHSLIQCWARRQASRHRKLNVRTRIRNVFTQILNSQCFTFVFNFLTNLYIWTLDVASILHETWSYSTSSIIVVADNSETQFFFFFAITCSRLASRRRQRHTPKTKAKWKERNIHSFIDSVLRLWIALTPHSHLRIDECAREEFSSSSFECSFHSPLLASSSSSHRRERKQARMYGVLKNRSFHFISNINRLGSIKSEWHDATTWATSGECFGRKRT